MPRIDDYGFGPKFQRLEQILDKTDKVARLGLRIAYAGLGVGIAAVIIALLPFIIK